MQGFILLLLGSAFASCSFSGNEITILSSTKNSIHRMFAYKLCLPSTPLHVEAKVETIGTATRNHSFNASVVEIYMTHVLLELKRTDQNTGWELLELNVTWTAYLQLGCRYGRKLGSTCYKAVYTKRNYTDAALDCGSRGGRLAAVKSNAIANLIAEMVKPGHTEFFIGLDDRQKPGTFVYSDGSLLSNSFKLWGPSQPNPGKEHCVVHIVTTSPGDWHDWPCSSLFGYICQYPLTYA